MSEVKRNCGRVIDERKRLVKTIDAAGNVTTYRYTPLSAQTLALAHSLYCNHPASSKPSSTQAATKSTCATTPKVGR